MRTVAWVMGLASGALLFQIPLAAPEPDRGARLAASRPSRPVSPPGTAVAPPPQPGSGTTGADFDWASVALRDSVPFVAVNDLARLLGATKFWRSDVRKLVLRVDEHTIKLTADNPYVVLDERTYLMPGPAWMLRGELQVPVALARFAEAESIGPRIRYDPVRRRAVRLPDVAIQAPPSFSFGAGRTRIVFTLDRPAEVRVVSRGRSRFRLRFEGSFAAQLPESLPPSSLVRKARVLPAVAGAALELQLSPQAAAFRLEPDTLTRRLVFEVIQSAPAGPMWQSFAPELPPGPRWLRSLVIDPGHGGSDLGVVASGGLREKDLTLALARLLRGQLNRRLPATRVFLTRDSDRAPTLAQRVETANRARPDVVLSLHFDRFPQSGVRGVTVLVPPATFGEGDAAEAAPRGGAPLVLVPWRDAATRFAVPSRELAEDLLGALELHGFGPSCLREQLPYSLLGVNAPGVLLECGMFSSPLDRRRLATPRGLSELAEAIAEGLESYPRAGPP